MDHIRSLRTLAFIAILAIALLGCATTDEVILDSTKRPPTKSVEIFKDGKLPDRKHKEIAELSFLGPREEELRAQKRFIDDAKKMGGNAIIFTIVDAGTKGGGTLFQTLSWVFKGKVIVYE